MIYVYFTVSHPEPITLGRRMWLKLAHHEHEEKRLFFTLGTWKKGLLFHVISMKKRGLHVFEFILYLKQKLIRQNTVLDIQYCVRYVYNRIWTTRNMFRRLPNDRSKILHHIHAVFSSFYWNWQSIYKTFC